MAEDKYQTFRYRWVVLFALVPIIVSSEIFWLTFANIAGKAQDFYRVGGLGVDLFSISYMVMYILFAIPASWVIDKYGFKASVIIGSVITAVFGLTRYLFAGNYALALTSQFLLAAGQPFLVNISTKVPANWFPVKERSTAAGVLLMAQYIGFIIPLNASPVLVDRLGMGPMLGVYAVIAVVSAALALLLPREKPVVAPGPEAPKEAMSLSALRGLLTNRGFVWVLVLSFISMGLFNTLMTKIEDILAPRHFTAGQSGLVFTLFVVTGIVGAVVVPLLSDRLGQRVPVFIAGIAAMGPLVLGLAFLPSFPLVLAAAALLGFLIMGIAPVLFQHGAEVAYPAQEGASFGFIMLVGQISGIAFVCLFDAILGWAATVAVPMALLTAFVVLQIPITALMKESDTIRENTSVAVAGKNQA